MNTPLELMNLQLSIEIKNRKGHVLDRPLWLMVEMVFLCKIESSLEEKLKYTPVNSIYNSVFFYKLGATLQYHRNLMPRVQKMFSQITGKHSLLEDSALLQSPPGRSIQDEASEEGDQLAVLTQHWLDGGDRQGPVTEKTKEI